MTTLTIPTERISERARRVDPRGAMRAVARVLVAVLVGIPYVLGWAVARVWLGLTLAWVAFGEGWRDGARAVNGGRTRG